jgi:hypothetical protein
MKSLPLIPWPRPTCSFHLEGKRNRRGWCPIRSIGFLFRRQPVGPPLGYRAQGEPSHRDVQPLKSRTRSHPLFSRAPAVTAAAGSFSSFQRCPADARCVDHPAPLLLEPNIHRSKTTGTGYLVVLSGFGFSLEQEAISAEINGTVCDDQCLCQLITHRRASSV